MSETSGETLLGPLTGGPYFTKYSDDHWVSPTPDTLYSSVMFKDKEYPSASAALEAYIKQHEGRPGSFLPSSSTSTRPVEPVEELLTPYPSSSTRGEGFVDQVQAQRLKALKKMVDEAYERLEVQQLTRSRGGVATAGQNISASANRTLTESQRVLTCISPLPGVTPAASEATTTTEALLNTQPQPYLMASSSVASGRKSCKTMQDYVEEARRAGSVDPSILARTRAGSSDPHYSPIIGSTARPTVLSVPQSSRRFAPNGGRSPPGWVKDLNGSAQTTNSPHPGGRTYPATHHRAHFQDVSAQSRQSKDDMYLLAESRDPSVRFEGTSQFLDKLSLTTDDLVYATPDGRSLSALKFKPTDLSNSTTPNASHYYHPGGTSQEPSHLLSHMRRDFADKLLREIDEGSSSIIAGGGADPGGAYHHPGGEAAYQSPILAGYSHRGMSTTAAPGGATSPVAYSPTRLKTLGLLTPETERLLSNPPRLGAMPGYIPSPIMPPLSGSSSTSPVSPTSDQGFLPPQSHDQQIDPRDLSADFTERVRALLLAPPRGDELSHGADDTTLLTEEILAGDRDWEKQPSFKPPKYIRDQLNYGPRLDLSKEKRSNIVDSFLKECLDETDKERPLTLSGPHQQPGSMEALKNMLFKVQSMVPPPTDQSVNDSTTTDATFPPGEQIENHVCPLADDILAKNGAKISVPDVERLKAENKPLSASQKSLATYQHLVNNSESFGEQTGTESLQKAMEHLDRLKSLVKETE